MIFFIWLVSHWTMLGFPGEVCFWAHLAIRAKWAFLITLRPVSSSSVKLLQKSFPLKILGQIKPNLATIIIGVSSLKNVWRDPPNQPRWPPWLKKEHMGEMQFLAYNSKKPKHLEQIWHGVKLFIRSRSICPEIFRWIGQPVVGLLPLNW